MPTTAEEKQALRQLVRKRASRFTTADREVFSLHIKQRIEAHPRFREAQVLLLFHSLPDEPSTHTFICEWCTRKTILLPAVTGDAAMELRAVRPDIPLTEGRYGIMQPGTAAWIDYGAIDLALIPGMSFDNSGHRLGRGRGYYDRMLSEAAFSGVYKMGVCYPYQMHPHVPSEWNDIEMDEVITAE